jgi:hypothetical protein
LLDPVAVAALWKASDESPKENGPKSPATTGPFEFQYRRSFSDVNAENSMAGERPGLL